MIKFSVSLRRGLQIYQSEVIAPLDLALPQILRYLSLLPPVDLLDMEEQGVLRMAPEMDCL